VKGRSESWPAAEPRRPARVQRGGGVPALPRPREEAEEARLDVAEPPVALACTRRPRPRRIDVGGAPAGGSTPWPTAAVFAVPVAQGRAS
jgi:hypothetical protein